MVESASRDDWRAIHFLHGTHGELANQVLKFCASGPRPNRDDSAEDQAHVHPTFFR